MTVETSPCPTGCDKRISVVLPVYNEGAVIERLYREIVAALDRCDCQGELVFVNDGSTDDSPARLDRIAQGDCRVRVLHLSRNFGHQAAVHAGLSSARGDAVVVMDTDMQDNPAALPALVAKWRDGYDVVYAVRTDRKEGLVKRFLFRAFYRVLNLVSSTPIPNDAGNFGLIDRRVADSIVGLREYDRYYPGLRQWVGFRQTGVTVPRERRHDTKPRVSWWGLARLAKTAIFSFSSVPLALFYVVAAVSLLTCGLFSGFALYHRIVTGWSIPGWTSIIIVASFFGALNALGIGVLGEYVVRIHDQVRDRPKFIVRRQVCLADGAVRDQMEELAESVTDLQAEARALAGERERGAVSRKGATAPVDRTR
jgi:dolichol-phosphate mannosyltransferase